jgi:thioredoxin 1
MKVKEFAIIGAVVVAAAAIVLLKQGKKAESAGAAAKTSVEASAPQGKALPRLVDLGAGKCIPCKMMKPILDDLKANCAETFKTEFIDVWENADAGKQYGINIIPTQIFYGADGKELFRHEGFYSKEDILGKWKEFGVVPAAGGASAETAGFSRWTAAQPDTRAKDTVCYMCDGDINPKTQVLVKSAKGDVKMCSLHCYFIMYSCLTEDKAGFESKVSVADFETGDAGPLESAVFVVSADEKSGRPTVKAFAELCVAEMAQKASGGSVVQFEALKAQELAHRCGFCDRAVYPADAAEVLVADGARTWGCCSHCALGVAVRTGKDIEVRERDRLTGEPVVVKTLNGGVASLVPPTAVAWFGQRTKPDGSKGSAGCFHQGFFVNAGNLKKWAEAHPLETGEQITIAKALSDKMKLSPQQVSKACKIGECCPK